MFPFPVISLEISSTRIEERGRAPFEIAFLEDLHVPGTRFHDDGNDVESYSVVLFPLPLSLSLLLSRCVSQVHPGVGVRPDLVRGEAVVGRRARGVRERHVERDRLRHELVVRRDRRAPGGGLLQGAEGDRGTGGWNRDRAATGTVGHLGPDAHIRGTLLCREYLQVVHFSYYIIVSFGSKPTFNTRTTVEFEISL